MLPSAVHQALCWPTPSAISRNDDESFEKWSERAEEIKKKGINGNGAGMPLGIAVKSPWPTPMAADGEKHTTTKLMHKVSGTITEAVHRTWATPASRDWRHPNAHTYAERGGGTKGEQLPNQIHGTLNPDWVEILMGWPIGWTSLEPCAGIWPGWPAGMGPDQYDYEPPRVAPRGATERRVARVKMCGNGVVWQQAAIAYAMLFKMITEEK